MISEVAYVTTGGTIASICEDPFDLLNYGKNETRLAAEQIVASIPFNNRLARIRPIPFRNISSNTISFPDWLELANLCDQLQASDNALSGIVIGHGTASIEETAYCLSLTLKVKIPVVIVGSMRPLSALSTDAHLNLVAAVRVASDPRSIGRGVLVVLNDEIHAARDVTKTSTFRLHAFQSPDFGILGQIDGDEVHYYRQIERRHTTQSEFTAADIAKIPRVDVAYSYVGSDGTAIRAFVAAGAQGIVSAGFGPGIGTAAELKALEEAVLAGVVVLQSTRVGSGRASDSTTQRSHGILAADNLSPQKARILLGLALSKTKETTEIERIFRTY